MSKDQLYSIRSRDKENMNYNNKLEDIKKKHMNGNLEMQNTTSEIKINWCD